MSRLHQAIWSPGPGQAARAGVDDLNNRAGEEGLEVLAGVIGQAEDNGDQQ